jgi:predicted alpha/beta superfamily hydrolase
MQCTKVSVLLMVLILTLVAGCSYTQSHPAGISNTGGIAMLCPENHAIEVTTDELIKIYFKEPPVYDPDGYITIYNQDGTVFEKINLSSAQMIDQKSTRIMFDPENDFEIGETYYIVFDEKPFGENNAIVHPTDWTFTVGVQLIEKNMSYGDTDFRLLIRLPKGYDPQGPEKYPVIYLTDGGFFNSSQYAKIGQAAVEGRIQEVIVVGLAYPEDNTIDDVRANRVRDLMKRPGDFLDFIQDEVIPYIDGAYRTDPSNRTLMGNSAGGYFAVWTLLQYRESKNFPFTNVISVAPPRLLSMMEDEQAAAISDLPLNVFLAVGLEDKEERVWGVQQLIDRLESRSYPGLNLEYRFLEGLPHGEVSSSPAFKEALELFLGKE